MDVNLAASSVLRSVETTADCLAASKVALTADEMVETTADCLALQSVETKVV